MVGLFFKGWGQIAWRSWGSSVDMKGNCTISCDGRGNFCDSKKRHFRHNIFERVMVGHVEAFGTLFVCVLPRSREIKLLWKLFNGIAYFDEQLRLMK